MIDITKVKTVKIGRQGENIATEVTFNIQPFITAYGSGSVQLLHQRSGDEVPYIATITQGETSATWTLSKDDTAREGYGRGQLNYYVGDLLAKSVVFTTYCENSLTDETETPEKVKSDLALIAEAVEKKQNKLIAGDNIIIEGDVISSTGGGGSVEVDEVTLTNDNGIIKVKNGGIDTAQIKNAAVTNGKLADYSVTKSKLENDLQNAVDSISGKATQTALGEETTARQNADNNLQGQIDAITVSSDVIDVVGTYTDLENYDTTHVKANDIIKVLSDSTHNDALSYYRWIITGGVGAWTYVGSEGPFYTKSEADILLQAKLGTDAVKQTEGQSVADVMSQKAVTAALSGKLSNPLIFTNVSVSSWVDNATTPDQYFEDYAYKSVIACQGVSVNMLATVIFADEQEQSGDYSTKCKTGANTVTIYSNDNSAITIPTIVAGVPIEINVNEGGSGHNYSSDEQVIGTWTDGKPLYEKTFEFTQNVQGTATIDLSSYLPSTCIPKNAFVSFTYTSNLTTSTMVNAFNFFYLRRNNDANVLYGKLSENSYSITFNIIAQYTKSTD